MSILLEWNYQTNYDCFPSSWSSTTASTAATGYAHGSWWRWTGSHADGRPAKDDDPEHRTATAGRKSETGILLVKSCDNGQ
jgi:hypothetical protein